MVAESLRMVAQGCRNDTTFALLIVEHQQGISGASLFEANQTMQQINECMIKFMMNIINRLHLNDYQSVPLTVFRFES